MRTLVGNGPISPIQSVSHSRRARWFLFLKCVGPWQSRNEMDHPTCTSIHPSIHFTHFIHSSIVWVYIRIEYIYGTRHGNERISQDQSRMFPILLSFVLVGNPIKSTRPLGPILQNGHVCTKYVRSMCVYMYICMYAISFSLLCRMKMHRADVPPS